MRWISTSVDGGSSSWWRHDHFAGFIFANGLPPTVTVSAADMGSAIASTGRVALYGILFDTNSSTIKPESTPALEQIAALMTQQPALKLTLPESSQASNEGGSDLAPVIISVDQEGNIYLGAKDQPVTDAVLEQQLRALVQANPKVRIALQMDEDSPVAAFVKITDAARAAGVKSGLALDTRKKGQP